MKVKKVLEKDLEVDTVYLDIDPTEDADNVKCNSLKFMGFNEDKDGMGVVFVPVVNTRYIVDSDGFVVFEHDPNAVWFESVSE